LLIGVILQRKNLVLLAVLDILLLVFFAVFIILPQGSPGSEGVIMVGAGDIASCGNENDSATALLLDSIPGVVFTLGDTVYDNGSAQEFLDCYSDNWGRHKDRTLPALGNHDYNTPGAKAYFDYFDYAGESDKGYYSYNYGDWHVVVLNSNCNELGGCAPDSEQLEWLRKDLTEADSKCTLAYMHHPRYSSGTHGSQNWLIPIWNALYAGGVEIALAGHDHSYERFAPQDPFGTLDPEFGVRQFVVGTGGINHYEFLNTAPNSEVKNNDSYGVLKLTLKKESYDWAFVPVEGSTFTDSGSGTCH